MRARQSVLYCSIVKPCQDKDASLHAAAAGESIAIVQYDKPFTTLLVTPVNQDRGEDVAWDDKSLQGMVSRYLRDVCGAHHALVFFPVARGNCYEPSSTRDGERRVNMMVRMFHATREQMMNSTAKLCSSGRGGLARLSPQHNIQCFPAYEPICDPAVQLSVSKYDGQLAVGTVLQLPRESVVHSSSSPPSPQAGSDRQPASGVRAKWWVYLDIRESCAVISTPPALPGATTAPDLFPKFSLLYWSAVSSDQSGQNPLQPLQAIAYQHQADDGQLSEAVLLTRDDPNEPEHALLERFADALVHSVPPWDAAVRSGALDWSYLASRAAGHRASRFAYLGPWSSAQIRLGGSHLCLWSGKSNWARVRQGMSNASVPPGCGVVCDLGGCADVDIVRLGAELQLSEFWIDVHHDPLVQTAKCLGVDCAEYSAARPGALSRVKLLVQCGQRLRATSCLPSLASSSLVFADRYLPWCKTKRLSAMLHQVAASQNLYFPINQSQRGGVREAPVAAGTDEKQHGGLSLSPVVQSPQGVVVAVDFTKYYATIMTALGLCSSLIPSSDGLQVPADRCRAVGGTLFVRNSRTSVVPVAVAGLLRAIGQLDPADENSLTMRSTLKLVVNSIYGSQGKGYYSVGDKRVAESTASAGRLALSACVRLSSGEDEEDAWDPTLVEHLRCIPPGEEGLRTIMANTDGIMLEDAREDPESVSERSLSLVRRMEDLVNDHYSPRDRLFSMHVEGVYSKVVFARSSNGNFMYQMYAALPRGSNDPTLRGVASLNHSHWETSTLSVMLRYATQNQAHMVQRALIDNRKRLFEQQVGERELCLRTVKHQNLKKPSGGGSRRVRAGKGVVVSSSSSSARRSAHARKRFQRGGSRALVVYDLLKPYGYNPTVEEMKQLSPRIEDEKLDAVRKLVRVSRERTLVYWYSKEGVTSSAEQVDLDKYMKKLTDRWNRFKGGFSNDVKQLVKEALQEFKNKRKRQVTGQRSLMELLRRPNNKKTRV